MNEFVWMPLSEVAQFKHTHQKHIEVRGMGNKRELFTETLPSPLISFWIIQICRAAVKPVFLQCTTC